MPKAEKKWRRTRGPPYMSASTRAGFDELWSDSLYRRFNSLRARSEERWSELMKTVEAPVRSDREIDEARKRWKRAAYDYSKFREKHSQAVSHFEANEEMLGRTLSAEAAEHARRQIEAYDVGGTY